MLFERDEKKISVTKFSSDDAQGKILSFCLLLEFCRGTIVRLGEKLPENAT